MLKKNINESNEVRFTACSNFHTTNFFRKIKYLNNNKTSVIVKGTECNGQQCHDD